MSDSGADETIDLTNGGIMASRHAPPQNAGMMASRFAPTPASAPETATEPEQSGKKRSRVRKRTRDARARAWELEQAARAAEGSAGESDAAEGEAVQAPVVADDSSSAQRSVLAAGGQAVDNAAEVLPATSSSSKGKATMTTFEHHEDTIRRLRDEHHVEIESYYNQILDSQQHLAEAAEAVSSKDAQIAKLKAEVTELHNDVDDPQRGYAVQLTTAEARAIEDKSSIDLLRKDLDRAQQIATSLEDKQRQQSTSISQLRAQIKSKEIENTRLQAQHDELQAKLDSPVPDPAIDQYEHQLEEWEAYDESLNERMDQLLQGMVNTNDAAEKLEAIGKLIHDARETADKHQAARDAAQRQIDKHNSQRAKLSLSNKLPSVSYTPVVIQKPVSVSTGIQTSPQKLSFSALTSISEEPVAAPAVSTTDASSQTLPAMTTSSQGSQTIPPALMNAATQTLSSKYSNAITQTPSSKYSTASIQTANTTAVSAGLQTTPPADVTATQTARVKYSTSSTQTDLPSTSPLPPTVLSIIDTPQASHVKSAFDTWLLLSILALLVAWMWHAFLRYIDNPDYWTLSGYQTNMYKQDLARVGIERWLGVDTSCIG